MFDNDHWLLHVFPFFPNFYNKVSEDGQNVNFSSTIIYVDDITVTLDKCADIYTIRSPQCPWEVVLDQTEGQDRESVTVFSSLSEGGLCGLC